VGSGEGRVLMVVPPGSHREVLDRDEILVEVANGARIFRLGEQFRIVPEGINIRGRSYRVPDHGEVSRSEAGGWVDDLACYRLNDGRSRQRIGPRMFFDDMGTGPNGEPRFVEDIDAVLCVVKDDRSGYLSVSFTPHGRRLKRSLEAEAKRSKRAHDRAVFLSQGPF
jgi:hypothetical protein